MIIRLLSLIIRLLSLGGEDLKASVLEEVPRPSPAKPPERSGKGSGREGSFPPDPLLEENEGNSKDCLGVLVRHQFCSSALLLLKLQPDMVAEGSCREGAPSL